MNTISRDAAAYWDENREKANDPTFWMAHPLCRMAINRRVSGNPHEWPVDWFKRVHVGKPFSRGLSFGSGLGALERALIQGGIVGHIDAFDISPVSVEDARREAQRHAISGIDYRVGDFNDPRLERSRYDIVFFHQSLHHVSALERLFRRLSLALQPGALLYLDEYVGPSRDDWTTAKLSAGQASLDRLPAEAKLSETLLPPIEENDPSEAVRSGEIASFVRAFFDVVEWRPYGGQIVDLVLPLTRNAWAHSQPGLDAIDEMLRQEDEALTANPGSTHYLVAVGRIKPPQRLLRALGPQFVAALARRAVRMGRRVRRLVGAARGRLIRYFT